MDASLEKRLAELAPKIMNAFHDLGQQHPTGERLSMRQYQTLIIINATENLTLSGLCEKLNLAPSTATELVNRMISLEYVTKQHEEQDHRNVQLQVSPKGLRLLKEREEAMAMMFHRFLEPFPDEDKAAFVEAFQQIWELIKKYRLARHG